MRRLKSVLALLTAMTPGIALAQPKIEVITDSINECDFKTGKLETACIPLFIGHLVEIVFGLVGIFFILNVIYAGYQLALGSVSGDRGKGKDRLVWSIIGLIVTACAFLILDLVLTVIGV